MKCSPFILAVALLAGCATDDVRLHGTWHSNQEATVTAAFQQDPKLTKLPPENIERFKDGYGHLTLTYSNGVATSSHRGKQESWHYRVIESGSDFVVIRSDGAPKEFQDARIHFVDDGRSYWVDGGARFSERFDRVDDR